MSLEIILSDGTALPSRESVALAFKLVNSIEKMLERELEDAGLKGVRVRLFDAGGHHPLIRIEVGYRLFMGFNKRRDLTCTSVNWARLPLFIEEMRAYLATPEGRKKTGRT